MIRNTFLVDHDARRRAAICHSLQGNVFHVEPYEDMIELAAHWPDSGVLLVHDEGQVVSELIGRMATVGDWLPVICFAENPSMQQVVFAAMRGAVNYLAWPFTSEQFAQAIDAAEHEAGGIVSFKLREAMARERVNQLTRREKEVLAGVAQGLSNRLIGEKLEISPRTVEIHRANLLSKLGLRHSSEAIRIAIEASLVH